MPKLARQYLSTMRAVHYLFVHPFSSPAKLVLKREKEGK